MSFSVSKEYLNSGFGPSNDWLLIPMGSAATRVSTTEDAAATLPYEACRSSAGAMYPPWRLWRWV